MVSLSLQGKVALITGGSRGIGAETVRLFHQAGAKVVFNYHQARESALAVVEECGGSNECVAVQQELSDAQGGQSLVEVACRSFGQLDALVVNHGIWPPEDESIATMSSERWDRTMGVNLDSVFGLVKAAVGQFQRQKAEALREGAAGHIVLISSTAGQRGEAFHADYAVTKGALISLTKSLSSELAGEGIYVNCVAPGWVRTDMSASTFDDPEAHRRIMST